MATSPATRSAGFVFWSRLAGNESTSVALSLPLKRRFKSRIVRSVVSSTVTSPSKPTAACASLRYGPSVRFEGMRRFFFSPDAANCFAWADANAESGSRSGSRRIIVRKAANSVARGDFDSILCNTPLIHWACEFPGALAYDLQVSDSMPAIPPR